jgi:hypothetical protein
MQRRRPKIVLLQGKVFTLGFDENLGTGYLSDGVQFGMRYSICASVSNIGG